MEAVRFTYTSVDEIGINDSSRYPLDEFIHEDDPSRQYQANFDISYYVIPHGRSLTELTHENHVLKVIAPNELETLTLDVGRCFPSPIIQSSLYKFSSCMLTRSMAAKLTAATASECLFADFLFEIEAKKEERIDYDETFAPVARMEGIRIFLSFATCMNFTVFQIDVKSAFLNALYGLKQARKAWYDTLSTFLIQNKFTRGRIDNTLFIYKLKGDVLLIQVYVDDIIFGTTRYKLCKQFEKLMTKKFEMSMIGELTYFLGLQIKHDEKGISICQEQYTRNLLKKYEISNSSSVKTPMVPPNNLGPDLASKLVNETSYRGMIGSLMYLTATRPDI
ncbi:retrovirus-related pol polyprotein from transposon TNT 1-94 [Tanacetum coccineum]